MSKKLVHIFTFLILFTNRMCKMINFDDVAREKKMTNNSGWSYIPDHKYRILIMGGSR